MRHEPPGAGAGLLERAFRAVVRLYPPAFRRDLGEDMVRSLRDDVARCRRRHGRLRGWACALGSLLGTVSGALRERIHEAWGQRAGGHLKRGTEMMREGFRQDVMVLFRHLRRRPAFGFIVVGTLALGIGVTTAVFSVVRGVLLRPLPYPEPEELVYLYGGGASSLPNLGDLQERLQTLDVAGVWVPSPSTLTGEGEPVELSLTFVSGGFFRMLGVAPAAGRLLGPEDDGEQRVVLSHGVWTTRFGADPGVVGRTLTIDDRGFEVVGVAPASMTVPFDAELLAAFPWGPDAGPRTNRAMRAVEVYGRIVDGRTLEDVRGEVATEWARLQAEHPDENGKWAVSAVGLREQVTGDETTPLAILFWASVLFLLVACANVANLLLSRLESREREFAIRAALGAGRGRLLGQAWTEAMALGLLGGAVGTGLAFALLDGSLALFGGSLSRLDAVRMDGAVLAFSLGASLLTGLAVGVATVVAWRTDTPGGALRRTTGGVGRTSRFRRVLVWGEVALSLMMVTGLALLVRSFLEVRAVDVGVEPDAVVLVEMGSLPGTGYPDAASRLALIDRLGERLGALPGVDGVSFASRAPLGGCCNNGRWERVDDGDIHHRFVEARAVTPGYFEVLGVPLRTGRALTAADGAADVPVVVVNETLARSLWEGGNPVGQLVRPAGSEGSFEVVGVVGDVREYSPEREAPPMAYLPAAQLPRYLPYALLRTDLPAGRVSDQVRAAVGEVEPMIPVSSVRSLAEVLAEMTADRRATTSLMALMGALAFLLGGIGVYGVMSQTVLGRLREIGVRLALGANRTSVLGEVLRHSVVLVLPGLILGTGGAVAAHGLVESLLFGVEPFDPWIYGGVVLAFVVAAVVAALGPAARAARVDPVRVLKEGG